MEKLLREKYYEYFPEKNRALENKLPPIISKEIEKTKDKELQVKLFEKKMLSVSYVVGALLEEVLEDIWRDYGERLYLALAIAIPTYLSAHVLKTAHEVAKSPRDAVEKDVRQLVKSIKESFNASSIVDEALHVLEVIKTLLTHFEGISVETIKSAEYVGRALKIYGGEDIPKIVEASRKPLADCLNKSDLYERKVCKVCTASTILTKYLIELATLPAEARVGIMMGAVFAVIRGAFATAFAKGLYRKEGADALKQKLGTVAPGVLDFVHELVDDMLASSRLEEAAPQVVRPAVPTAFEQAFHYIGLAIDSLEQAEKKLKSISRVYKGFAIFVLIVYLVMCVYLTPLVISTLWSPPKSILDYIVLYLEIILLGPFFVGIFFWGVIAWFLVMGLRFSHRAKIVRRNIDALRGISPHAFSPSTLSAVSVELKAASFHTGVLSLKTLEASHYIEDALYYLQKAAELMSQQQQ